MYVVDTARTTVRLKFVTSTDAYVIGENEPTEPGGYGVTLVTAPTGSGPYRCGNSIDSGSVGTPGSQRTGAVNRSGST